MVVVVEDHCLTVILNGLLNIALHQDGVEVSSLEPLLPIVAKVIVLLSQHEQTHMEDEELRHEVQATMSTIVQRTSFVGDGDEHLVEVDEHAVKSLPAHLVAVVAPPNSLIVEGHDALHLDSKVLHLIRESLVEDVLL